MKKITKSELIRIINSNLTSIDIQEEIDYSKITELKLGKNFIYTLENYPELSNIQRRLNKFFLNKIEISNCAVAYRTNYSYYHLLEPHRHNYNFLRIDIKSFFYSIDLELLKECFISYFDDDSFDYLDENLNLLNIFIKLITLKLPVTADNIEFRGKIILPIGFITSPSVSNIFFRKLDILIQKYCSEKNIEYTRYADDMLFSSGKNSEFLHSETFMKEMKIILLKMKLKINEKKTLKKKHTISLNGYTLQYSNFKNDGGVILEENINEIRLSNKKTIIINKFIIMVNKKKLDSVIILKKLFNLSYPTKKQTIDQLLNKATGYRSFLLSIIVFNNKYKSTSSQTISKYLKIINNLEKTINILAERKESEK